MLALRRSREEEGAGKSASEPRDKERVKSEFVGLQSFLSLVAIRSAVGRKEGQLSYQCPYASKQRSSGSQGSLCFLRPLCQSVLLRPLCQSSLSFMIGAPSLVQMPSLLPNAICPRGKANSSKSTKASFRFPVLNPMFGLAQLD